MQENPDYKKWLGGLAAEVQKINAGTAKEAEEEVLAASQTST